MEREQAEMRHLEEAEEQYKLDLAADPKHVNSHLNYGNLLYRMERLEEAEEQYKLVIKLDPKHANRPNGSIAVMKCKIGQWYLIKS